MKKRKLFLTLLLLNCIAFAQKRQLRGTVENFESGVPISQATCKLKSKSIVTATNSDRTFTPLYNIK
jgi:hypothetical protein